jgi:ribosome biogenesis GTPase
MAARLPHLEVILTSSAIGQGIEAIRAKLPFGTTGTFVGSSGVGKSTLLNAISGRQQMATQAISFDGKGKHTTTHRELCFVGPEHGMIIDTPGMREIQLPVSDAAFDDLFGDIIALGNNCFYRNCSHQAEPGCAIKKALATEQLAPERWKQYQKMLSEQAYQRRRENKAEELAEKQKWKRIHKQMRQKKPF